MRAWELFDSLSKKFETSSPAVLAANLGLSAQTLANWQKQGKTISPSQLATAIVKARKAAVQDSQNLSIRSIVELYPIEAVSTKRETAWEVFSTNSESTKYARDLKTLLLGTNGIYVFYDSRGHSLYVGKAREQSLWKEMNLAFNRKRDVQRIKLTHHPDRNQGFQPGYEKLRQPTDTQLPLCELAYYFSAYQVEIGMIENIEALMIRAFANDLLNVKMEKLAAHRK